MRELIDCHVHTQRCGHAKGTAADYVTQAASLGLTGIVFTEHLALPQRLDPRRRLSMHPSELPEYVAEVDAARQACPEMEVTLGLEADYLPDNVAKTATAIQVARSLGVTVVLGSVHFIDGWAFDDPSRLDEWTGRDVGQAWSDYFSLWIAAVNSGLFDVMAHPDLIKKFGRFPSFDTTDIFDECARAAAQADVAIEVSTAGLRKPVGELYPGQQFLSAFQSAGVRATVGSDAHEPSEVGYRINMAYDALRGAGYDSVVFPRPTGDWKELAL